MKPGIAAALRFRAFQVVLFLLLLLPAELFVSWVQSRKEARHDTIGGSYMPIRLMPEFEGVVGGRRFSTNNLGFREAPRVEPGPLASGRRILVLGDSITFGFGLPVSDTYPAILEQLLDQEGSFQVLNAAGQGYSPSSYWAYAHHQGLQLEPDTLVVQIELSNDITDEAFLDTSIDDDGSPRVRGGRYVVTWDGNLLGSVVLGPYGFEKTYLYNLCMRNLLKALESWRPPFSPEPGAGFTYFTIGPDRPLLSRSRIEKGWTQLFESLVELQNLVRDRGRRMLLLITPNRFLFQSDSLPRESRFAREILDRGLQMARQNRLETVDVREALAGAGGADLYLDFAHLNRTGQEVLATALRDRLLREANGE